MPPALFGTLAAAGVVLAGEGLTAVFVGEGGQGNANRRSQVGNEGEDGG
jgi:hypothetical protein